MPSGGPPPRTHVAEGLVCVVVRILVPEPSTCQPVWCHHVRTKKNTSHTVRFGSVLAACCPGPLVAGAL